MSETIHIIIPSSDWYMPYTLVLITSILSNKNEGDDIFIHIISEDLSDKYLECLECMKSNWAFRYEIKKVNRALISKIQPSVLERCPNICNYKLFISSLFDFDKAIVLEGDMIVLKSLGDLFKTPMEDCPMGAVKDPVCNECQDTLEIPNEYRYCNTGMFLANLDYWRKENCQNEFVKNAEKYKNKMCYPDQDIFNITFYKKMKYLPLQYNVYASVRRDNFLEERKEAYKDPIIIHWADYRKPWDYPEIRSANAFWKYARISPCYEIILSRMKNNIFDEGLKNEIRLFVAKYIRERKKISHKLFLRRIKYAIFHRKKDKARIERLKDQLGEYND